MDRRRLFELAAGGVLGALGVGAAADAPHREDCVCTNCGQAWLKANLEPGPAKSVLPRPITVTEALPLLLHGLNLEGYHHHAAVVTACRAAGLSYAQIAPPTLYRVGVVLPGARPTTWVSVAYLPDRKIDPMRHHPFESAPYYLPMGHEQHPWTPQRPMTLHEWLDAIADLTGAHWSILTPSMMGWPEPPQGPQMLCYWTGPARARCNLVRQPDGDLKFVRWVDSVEYLRDGIDIPV